MTKSVEEQTHIVMHIQSRANVNTFQANWPYKEKYR